MGIRGELYSTKVTLENRTYFFNVKENRVGDLYLNIVESKNKETGGFDRQSVVLFADDLQDFLKGFDESLRVMEKAVREKKKGARAEREERADREERRDRTERPDRAERKERGFDREKPRAERSFREEKHRPARESERPFADRGARTFGRADKPFKRREEGFAERGERPFVRDAGPEAAFGRKKFVKAGKHSAGAHGIKGPLHKNRVVKAVRKRELPED